MSIPQRGFRLEDDSDTELQPTQQVEDLTPFDIVNGELEDIPVIQEAMTSTRKAKRMACNQFIQTEKTKRMTRRSWTLNQRRLKVVLAQNNGQEVIPAPQLLREHYQAKIKERHFNLYIPRIASNMIEILSQLDQEFRKTSTPINVKEINKLWNLLIELPRSIVRTSTHDNEVLNQEREATPKEVTDPSEDEVISPRGANKNLPRLQAEGSIYQQELTVELAEKEMLLQLEQLSIRPAPNPKLEPPSNRSNSLSESEARAIRLNLNSTNKFLPYLRKWTDPRPEEEEREQNQEKDITLRIGAKLHMSNGMKKRITKLIESNNLSGAARTLGDLKNDDCEGKDQSVEEIYNTLCQLHDNTSIHTSCYSFAPKADALSQEELIQTPGEIVTILSGLNKKATTDIGGWTVPMLMAAIKKQPILSHLLMNVVNNCIVNGIYPDSIFLNRIIAIPKPGKPGQYRPISIPTTWRKLFSKALLCKHRKTLLRNLNHAQYGVGTPYSTDIIISSLQSAVETSKASHQEVVIVQLDMSSAFNRVDRGLLMKKLINSGLHPHALKYLDDMLCKDKLIYCPTSTVPSSIPNSRGVPQGELLSPMLFSLYLAEAITKTNNLGFELRKSRKDDQGELQNVLHFLKRCQIPVAMSYLDDIFIVSESITEAEQELELLIAELEKVQMIINSSKCHCLHITTAGEIDMETPVIVHPDRTSVPNSFSSNPTANRNNSFSSDRKIIIQPTSKLEVLGSLLSLSQEDRDKHFILKAVEALDILCRSTQINLQNFLLITRLCVSSRLTHLIRSIPISKQILHDFDEVVMSIISGIFNIENSNPMIQLTYLPFSFGGLSLASLANIQPILASNLLRQMSRIPHINNLIRVYLNQIGIYTNPSTSSSGKCQIQGTSALLNLSHEGPSTNWNQRLEAHIRCGQETCGWLGKLQELEEFLLPEDIIDPPEKMHNSHTLWSKQSLGIFKEILERTQKQNKNQTIILEALIHDTNLTGWLKEPPTKPETKMEDIEVYHSIRYRMGCDDGVTDYIQVLPKVVFKKKNTTKKRSDKKEEEEKDEEEENEEEKEEEAENKDGRLQCPLCGTRMTEEHYSSCQATGPVRTARHHIVKRILARVFASTPTLAIKVEDGGFMDNREDEEKKRIPDITVTMVDPSHSQTKLEKLHHLERTNSSRTVLTFGIDVVISEIHATHLKQWTSKGQFSEAGEKRKWKIYEDWNQKQAENKILPFGLSSIGGIGPCALSILEFIKEVSERHNHTSSLNSSLDQISFLLETTRSKMKEIYLTTIQERVRRVTNSLPKQKIIVQEIVTIPPRDASKTNYCSLRDYWQNESLKQQEVDGGSSAVALQREREQVAELHNSKWLQTPNKRELPSRNKEQQSQPVDGGAPRDEQLKKEEEEGHGSCTAEPRDKVCIIKEEEKIPDEEEELERETPSPTFSPVPAVDQRRNTEDKEVKQCLKRRGNKTKRKKSGGSWDALTRRDRRRGQFSGEMIQPSYQMEGSEDNSSPYTSTDVGEESSYVDDL